MATFRKPIPDEMRCHAITCKGERCKRPRMPGFDQCDTHGLQRKFYIAFQWRRDAPLGPRHHWRSWRHFGAWPILFDSRQDAEDHMHNCGGVFKNMLGKRKVSASVARTKKFFNVANPVG